MIANYDLLLPPKVLFNLKEIEEIGLIKTDMAKKLVYKGFLEIVKIGNKIHISREELIKYLPLKKDSLSESLGYFLHIFFLFKSSYLKDKNISKH